MSIYAKKGTLSFPFLRLTSKSAPTAGFLSPEGGAAVTIRADGSDKNKVLFTSILFCGLSHILYLKQYVKGILFALIEVIAIINIPKFVKALHGLITLGSPQPDVSIKLRDNSIFMLIDGVMALAVIFVFIAIYVISVKSALKEYKKFCDNKVFTSNRHAFSELTGKSFSLFALAPTVIMILFFVLVPLVFSALVAFTNYSAPDHIPPKNTVDWVGFQNFIDMFSGKTAWTSAFGKVALWTLAWGFLATFTCYFGGMLMAVVLHESKIKLKPVFRSIFILPYAVPSVISMLVWRNLMNGSFGTVNRTLIHLGIIKDVIPWLSDPWLAKFTCVLVNLWAGFPYFMLLVTGSMTAISRDIYEAAVVDGASKFQVFKSITLPLVIYQTTPLIIMSISHNINNFGAIFFVTGGGPTLADSTTTGAAGTDLLITWIYKLTINLLQYHYASVLAVLIFMVLAPFAIYNFRRTRAFKEGVE